MKHSSTPARAHPNQRSSWKAQIMKWADSVASEREAAREATRQASRPALSSMLKLATTALDLYRATRARDLIIDGEQGSPPLTLALTAMQAAVRLDQGELP
jgi:hypothetical protein